ncbi:hypothetical protein ACHAXT_012333 [Thalassiosira profunda]
MRAPRPAAARRSRRWAAAAALAGLAALCGAPRALAVDIGGADDGGGYPYEMEDPSRRRRLVLNRGLPRRLLADGDVDDERRPRAAEGELDAEGDPLDEKRRRLQGGDGTRGGRRPGRRPSGRRPGRKPSGGNNRKPSGGNNRKPPGRKPSGGNRKPSPNSKPSRGNSKPSGGGGKDKSKGGGGNKSKNGAAGAGVPECLCGYCVDSCKGLGDMCNPRDQCMFVGHGYPRPYALYLKTAPSFKGNLNSIRVDFKGDCPITVKKVNGKFKVNRPKFCEDDKGGLGTEVCIDFKGDKSADACVHTSCSDVLMAGTMIEGTPFIIEGYCVTDDPKTCQHVDGPERVCVPDITRRPTPRPTPRPTDRPTDRPTTAKPTTSPTSNPTSSPSTSPTGRPTKDTTTRLPLTDPGVCKLLPGHPDFNPSSLMVKYVSIGTCAPRGVAAEATGVNECEHGASKIFQAYPPPPTYAAVFPLPGNDCCRYTSFEIWRCKEASIAAALPLTNPVLAEFQAPIVSMQDETMPPDVDGRAAFDPHSHLVTYESDGCGPRGEMAEAQRASCPYGYRMVDRSHPEHPAHVVDGCAYFSYEVFECLPEVGGDRALEEEAGRALQEHHLSPFGAFDPASTLAGYISNDCGPRGKAALPDLSQCEYGHEKILYVPWQGGNTITEIDGCGYISLEVYECVQWGGDA